MTGEPEDIENYIKVQIDDSITIYISKEVMEKNKGEKELKFMVPEYGWQHLTFTEE
ncbi:hypothetical protein [Thermovenabulum gondwanense]|uniref:hypothetical protein n=1 Tax=Thermovenabulum gondwanense TaxID=520767 RepID=UPI0012EDD48E|nr:hypothetical protein [Thermovenabulum gondwanense]